MGVKIALFLILIYQVVVSPIIRQIIGSSGGCRFNPTCSQYASLMLKKHGLLGGSKKAIIRLSRCHPFGKPYVANI